MLQNNGQFFPHEGWDQRTLMQQCDPNANDVFPNVLECPPIQQGTSRLVASHLRFRLERNLGKSPLHNAAYNMFSMNMFNNKTFTDATFYATNFIGFVTTSQGMPAQEAFNKGVAFVLLGYIASVLESHPHLYNITDPNVVNNLNGCVQRLNGIMSDVNGYVQSVQQGGMNQMGHNNMGHNNMNIPANTMGGASAYMRQPQRVPQSAIQQAQGAVNGPRVRQAGSTGGGGHYQPPSSAAFTREVESPVNNQIIEEWGSNSMNTNSQINNTVEEPAALLDDRDDIPTDITEIVFDPYHYQPPGVTVDMERPFDVIYIPGGSKLVLAHTSKLTPSKNDVSQYPLCVDPSEFCHYYLIWPDGFIQDYFVGWTDDMRYIQHEINAELRGANIPSEGKLTKNSRHVSITLDDPKTVSELKTIYGEDIKEHHVLEQPVFIEETIITSSRLEDEDTVLSTIKSELNWVEPVDDIPSHVYLTEQLHPIEVEKEAENRLFMLMTADSLYGVSMGLKELLKDDLISIRVYRFINERFTKEINLALRDNLADDDLTVGSFVNDYKELLEIFRSEDQYEGLDVILEGKREKIIQQAMSLRLVEGEKEDEPDTLYVVDQQINYRVGFELAELADLVKVNEAKLISTYSTPNLSKLVISYIKDAKQKRKLPGRMYLITADGVYLEILIGWLGEMNYLIKRLA